MTAALTCPEGANDTGAYRLSWTGPDGARFVLEETDPSGQTRTLYEGEDHATTVSGRVAGEYRYELATGGGKSTCTVTVSPPSMSTAVGLFGFGLVVCAATVWVVVRGHRAHRRGDLS